MDFIKDIAGGKKEGQQQTQASTQKSSGGMMDKLNNMAGGGAKGEQNEDGLDKGTQTVCFCLMPRPARGDRCLTMHYLRSSVYMSADRQHPHVIIRCRLGARARARARRPI